jgi:transketolase C-terminal domain/subunit
LKTALLEGKKPAKFDKHIIGNLLLDVAPADEVRQEEMLIGVRNEAGDIYRLIGASKLNSFMNAVEELFDLGLIDELQDTEEPKDGCDAIFSEP